MSPWSAPLHVRTGEDSLETPRDAGHFRASAEVPAHIAAGCFFSNELVDALPVHRS